MLYFYQIYNTYVDLYYPNEIIRVFFTNDTGRVIKRPKNGPVSQYFIDHKGIILGQLANGTIIVLHNHIDAGKAVATTMTDFLQGRQFSYDYKVNTNDIFSILAIALDDIISQKPYNRLNNNCQVYVNNAYSNTPVSDDTGRVAGGIFAGLATILILGAIANIK